MGKSETFVAAAWSSSVKPGDLVRVKRFDDVYIGIYLGPAHLNTRARWRFLIDGKIWDADLANKLVYSYEVISETG
jgi:hypothetical protein